MDNFVVTPFSAIDLSDSFFNPLKESYPEFCDWFNNKSEAGEMATVYLVDGHVKDFLYIKTEEEALSDSGPCHFEPNLPLKKRLKIETFKVEPRKTRRGERLIKRALDSAIKEDVDEVYVTVFPEHVNLISLFQKYGFVEKSKKYHNAESYELVLVKDMRSFSNDILKDYPFVHTSHVNKYILSIYPKYHTLLFPDSILKNESYDLIQDLSHTNSIHKAYICFMQDIPQMKKGDNVVIYRTSDMPGKAYYRSVVSSICVVEQVLTKTDFVDVDDFIKQVKNYSIFSEGDLRMWYRKPNIYLVKMTYNVALNKRLTRGQLIEEVGIDANAYWGFLKITDAQYQGIRTKGEANESYFID